MKRDQENHRPGDRILNRYLPGADEKEREAARENLYGLFAVLAQIAERRASDAFAQQIRAPLAAALIFEPPTQS